MDKEAIVAVLEEKARGTQHLGPRQKEWVHDTIYSITMSLRHRGILTMEDQVKVHNAILGRGR